MKAFCYHEGIANPQFADHPELVQRWQMSWQRAGWEAVVLNRQHAEAHPSWAWFVARVGSLPTVNPPEYELACFVRWLAFAHVMCPGEVAVVGDYDCANLGFTPQDAMRIANPGRPVNTDVNFGSGPFILSKAHAEAIPPVMVTAIALLKMYAQPCGVHWADMEMWKANQYGNIGWQETVPVCLEYAPAVKAPLVHITYSSADRYGTTKINAWKELEARHVA